MGGPGVPARGGVQDGCDRVGDLTAACLPAQSSACSTARTLVCACRALESEPYFLVETYNVSCQVRQAP